MRLQLEQQVAQVCGVVVVGGVIVVSVWVAMDGGGGGSGWHAATAGSIGLWMGVGEGWAKQARQSAAEATSRVDLTRKASCRGSSVAVSRPASLPPTHSAPPNSPLPSLDSQMKTRMMAMAWLSSDSTTSAVRAVVEWWRAWWVRDGDASSCMQLAAGGAGAAPAVWPPT